MTISFKIVCLCKNQIMFDNMHIENEYQEFHYYRLADFSLNTPSFCKESEWLIHLLNSESWL